MKRVLPLLAVASLGLAGCGGSDETAAEATTTKSKTATIANAKKEPSAADVAKRGERSLKRSLDAELFPPYDSEIRRVQVSPTGWATVQVSGFERDEDSKQMATIVCGILISWFASTDEKYASYGYVELMDNTRLAECEIGKADIK